MSDSVLATATDLIEGYKAGLAGEPMGIVSAAFDLGWTYGAQDRAAATETQRSCHTDESDDK